MESEHLTKYSTAKIGIRILFPALDCYLTQLVMREDHKHQEIIKYTIYSNRTILAPESCVL